MEKEVILKTKTKNVIKILGIRRAVKNLVPMFQKPCLQCWRKSERDRISNHNFKLTPHKQPRFCNMLGGPHQHWLLCFSPLESLWERLEEPEIDSDELEEMFSKVPAKKKTIVKEKTQRKQSKQVSSSNTGQSRRERDAWFIVYFLAGGQDLRCEAFAGDRHLHQQFALER